jgi:anti-sigma28 factor (negative regulator of flagellin synthesis)
MSRIIDIGPYLPRMVPSYGTAANAQAIEHVPRTDAADVVDFSSRGRVLSFNIMHGSSLGDAKAAAIRSEIASGQFETPERMRGTVERLLDVIG